MNMKMRLLKSILALSLSSTLMTGCGGGGGDQNNTSSDPTSGTNNPAAGNNNESTSKYPLMFQNLDNFAMGEGYPPSKEALLSMGILDSITVLASQDLYQNQEIAKNSLLRHSQCEKGTNSFSGTYVYAPNEPNNGSANGYNTYTASSGVMTELINQPDETCDPSSFIDGSITYEIINTETSSTINATLGNTEPFIYELSIGGLFDGRTAFKGSYHSQTIQTSTSSYTYNVTIPSIEIFTINTKPYISEPYVKGPYEKDEESYYTNYSYQFTLTGQDTDDEKVVTDTSYEQEFKENGKTYLIEVSKHATKDERTNTVVRLETYTLLNPVDHSTLATGSLDTQKSSITLTKDGKSETRSLGF